MKVLILEKNHSWSVQDVPEPSTKPYTATPLVPGVKERIDRYRFYGSLFGVGILVHDAVMKEVLFRKRPR